jgi:hypothetical protein
VEHCACKLVEVEVGLGCNSLAAEGPSVLIVPDSRLVVGNNSVAEEDMSLEGNRSSRDIV